MPQRRVTTAFLLRCRLASVLPSPRRAIVTMQTRHCATPLTCSQAAAPMCRRATVLRSRAVPSRRYHCAAVRPSCHAPLPLPASCCRADVPPHSNHTIMPLRMPSCHILQCIAPPSRRNATKPSCHRSATAPKCSRPTVLPCRRASVLLCRAACRHAAKPLCCRSNVARRHAAILRCRCHCAAVLPYHRVAEPPRRRAAAPSSLKAYRAYAPPSSSLTIAPLSNCTAALLPRRVAAVQSRNRAASSCRHA